ncbi:MAG: YebC/PmpR family DNA-binding transcriptional regulator [Caldisericaceae bacterium]
MSGHSKWHNIQGRKSVQDAKRGKLFTKYTKAIIIAAKQGGGNTDTNASLRTAVDNAKKIGMPLDNIKKAIMRGTGEIPGVTYEEYTYEAYGPAGTAFIVKISTDNKNRTVAELRRIFSNFGGSLAENGSVSWNFETKGQIQLEEDESLNYDDLFIVVADAGGEDLKEEEGIFTVYTEPQLLEEVKKKLEASGLKISEADIVQVPKTLVKVTGDEAVRVVKLSDELENHDDVQDYYTNYDIDEEELKEIAEKLGS